MLTVNNLTKRYGDVLANSKVTFTAEDGQITLMVGPNGAGKSTAIKCIAGLLRFQGEVLIGPYRNKTLEAKRIFGYIPELPVMYDSLTVYEHLEFIGRAYGVKDWKQRADQLLERMELSDKVKKLGKELSKGMQQKVSICCALLPRPGKNFLSILFAAIFQTDATAFKNSFDFLYFIEIVQRIILQYFLNSV